MAVGTQTTIIGAEEHLRCKLLSSTFKDAALRWYMNLPKNSISSCSDFHKKFVRQFAGSKHIQVTATSLFSIRQGVSKTLREYLARFSEATIKVSNPNQEMFVADFQNGLKAGHFNESLAQKPAESMQEIMKRAECYIKGDEKKEKAGTIEGEGLSEIQKEGHARPTRNTPRSTAPSTGGNHQAGRYRNSVGITPDDKGKETARVAVNTIAGGFAGGGESNSARKRMCVDFTDLNKACPKDPYPLPSIDRLIDGALGCKVLSFMDAYSGYNQIKMNLPNAPHTAFMPITATTSTNHDVDLEEILAEVRRYNMRLNPAKCSFGVQAGKFLGFMLTSRGIEANTDKCEKAFHFFSTLKKGERFTWTTQCEEAFHKLKEFLASPPILARPIQGTPLHLYLVVSENAMSSALVQKINGEERPIYFVSRTFRGAETRYQKIERLSLAVIVTARTLRQYFQSHKIVVKTNFPIKQVLKKPDLVGRMVAWSVELSEYDITFSPRGSIKSQVLADFVLEMTTPPDMASTQPWTLSVDGASNLWGSGAGIVLEGPDGVLIEQSLRFAFKTSNNQAEYEALIAGMKLAKEMEVSDLKAKSDSQLVTNQVSGEYQTKDPQLIRYLEKVRGLAEQFDNFELIHVPRDQNSRADLLSKLASTKKPGNNRTVIQETISKPSTEMAEVTPVVEQSDWRLPIIQYLKRDILPAEKEDAARIKKISPYYTLIGDKLYKRGFSSPLLLCVRSQGRDISGRHSYTRPRSMYEAVTNARGPFTASQGQVKFLLVAVDYFTKWVEAEPMATISFDKGIKNTFVSVENPQANGQAESANKVILRALKRKLARKEKSWSEHLPTILWSYHTTVHTSTGETPFKMVYGADTMIPVEINPPNWRRETLNAPGNETALKENMDVLEEVREMAHFKEFAAKQRATCKYNTRVIPRSFKEGDLVLKRPMGKDKGGKLTPNLEGPFWIQEAFGGGAYRLETLKGETLPRTWNVANLKFYFS
ncbi:hypothetical protein TSUD_142870 [Trifolium subterraneum]|uniref:Uncharacterized protein n=1 Tax=Trifolium subterraneum TaxID=3900 RepID=A0A2Z6P1B0_TRISU|nr:hypothetical protein TSUD_142870 [Trifolium subterraneum]